MGGASGPGARFSDYAVNASCAFCTSSRCRARGSCLVGCGTLQWSFLKTKVCGMPVGFVLRWAQTTATTAPCCSPPPERVAQAGSPARCHRSTSLGDFDSEIIEDLRGRAQTMGVVKKSLETWPPVANSYGRRGQQGSSRLGSIHTNSEAVKKGQAAWGQQGSSRLGSIHTNPEAVNKGQAAWGQTVQNLKRSTRDKPPGSIHALLKRSTRDKPPGAANLGL